VPEAEVRARQGRVVSGRWRLDRLLGQGGMCDVYRAVEVASENPVAIKIVRSADPGLAKRLAIEARALEGFDHPGLVRLLDAGVDAEQAFIVMELVEGPTLAARLRRGPLGPSRTATLGTSLGGALAYVHERGIVHRDLKPANVLLGPRTRVRLADFGIARLLDTSALTATGSTLGTAAYMAPEQIEDHGVSTAADVWSLGLLLLECLTGRRAFEGTPSEVIARRLAGAVPFPADLPGSWRLLIEGMLEDDPERRPTAAEVAGMLSAAVFSEPWIPLESSTDADEHQRATLVDKRDPTLIAPSAIAGAVGPFDAAGAGPMGDPSRPRENRSPRLRRAGILVAALVVACGAALGGWLISTSNVAAKTPGYHRASATTTTTAATTTTTTTVPTAGQAAATLLQDVQSGMANGSIARDAGRSILDQLDQALAASDGGNPNALDSSVSAIESSIANGLSSGAISPGEAPILSSAAAALATAPGATTTTTAPAPSHVPGPPGKGQNNGPGSGD